MMQINIENNIMTEQEKYNTTVWSIATLLWVAGWIIAIKMKKGFWIGMGFSFIGSMLGYAVAYLVISKPKPETTTTTV